VLKAIEYYIQNQNRGDRTSAEVVKDTMEKLVLRDGFKIGASMSYVVENWENTRHASEELFLEAQRFLLDTDPQDIERLRNTNTKCDDKWLNDKKYSPDRAEKFRKQAREKLYGNSGVKL
jgi:hypothetical protein